MLSGKIIVTLIIATILSVIAALIIAARYRAAMQRFMKIDPNFRSTAAAKPETTTAGVDAPLPAAHAVSFAENRQAYQRLLMAFLLLTVVMSLTRTLQTQIAADGPITWKTVLALCLAYAWPVVPVIAVIERWRRRRLIGTLLLWFIGAVALLAWRTNEHVSLDDIISWLAFDIGLPLVVVSALCLGGATRAVGPWLAPIFILLCWASQAGVDVLAVLIDRQSSLVTWLVGVIPPIGAILLFALLPWVLAWKPAKTLGRWLAQAYTRRQISELFYLYTAIWVIALTGPALGALASGSWHALFGFLPLIWIPIGARVMAATTARRPAGRPPTLLVLRVFRQDANVQMLFDRVIERWRLTGNTVLIAGTDLVDRTIDADDIFAFIDSRLAERFILQPADVALRLNAFELQADLEGRYRINECYCHDNTWQQALEKLLQRSDAVLMDLRNFRATNEGCLHELRALAVQPGLKRVVILINDATEQPAAREAAQSTDDRFIWLQQPDKTPLTATDILSAVYAESGRQRA